jgi:hypothetical protein
MKKLGHMDIEAQEFDLDDLERLIAERDENDQSLPFTVSEQVQIGRAIEEALSRRKGERSDLKPVDHGRHVPEKGQKTVSYAAEKAGLGERPRGHPLISRPPSACLVGS